MSWFLAIIIGYLVGSIPTAYLAGRRAMGKDIREEGDRNPGAGNVYVSIGPRAGLMVGAVDIGKGVVAVLLAKFLIVGGGNGLAMAAGAAAVAGHTWPIFMKLRGGRGAATTVGVYCALFPIPALPISLACLALLPFVRSATLVLGLIMAPMPLLVWLSGYPVAITIYTIFLPMGVGVRHHLTSRNHGRELPPPTYDQEVEDKMLPDGSQHW